MSGFLGIVAAFLAAASILSLFALISIAVVRGSQRAADRRARLAAWAGHNGWFYDERPEVDWYRRMPGRNRRGVTVTLSRVVDGRRVTVAAYQYTESTSTGEVTTTSTHHLVVTVVSLRRVVPPLSVRPRGALSRMAQAMAGPGELSTGSAEFDRAFRVSADRREAVVRCLTPELIGAQLDGRLPAWSVEGYELLCYRRGKLDSPETVDARLER
jgi:hypothetical protein